MFLAFPLQFFPVRSITERYFLPHDDASSLMRKLWRFALVVLLASVGSVIPHFALVYGFVGGFAGCLLAFVLPITFYLALEKPRGEKL